MAAAPSLWNPKLGDLPQLRKLAKREISDEEVEWWSERVRHYTRQSFSIVRAMDRATYDLQQKQRRDVLVPLVRH
jgi:hypothetical protein